MARELTGQDYSDFLNYFSINFPALRSKFPKEIDWSLTAKPYGTRQPNDMSDEDFDSFSEIELRWLIENEITYEKENSPSFVLVKTGLTDIDINTVSWIEKITNNTTRVTVKHKSGMEDTFDIVGNIDFVKMKLAQE